jgi:hypothetical protein
MPWFATSPAKHLIKVLLFISKAVSVSKLAARTPFLWIRRALLYTRTYPSGRVDSVWVYFNSTEGEQVLIEKWIQRFDPNASERWTLTKLDGNILLLAASDGSGPEIGVATDVLSIDGHLDQFAATRQGGW